MEPEAALACYLVLVQVNLLGGKEVIAVDAFQADSEATALNYSRNLFLQSGGEAVVYGKASFFAGTIGSVEAEVIGVLDEEHEFNTEWMHAIQVFEGFLEAEDRKATLSQKYGQE